MIPRIPRQKKIKSLFDEWRDIHQLNSEEVCNLIVRDKIDILIDLNGHTALNSLEIFSMKPAPLQVSWLGYPNTTGLKQIDFIVGDEIVDPSELGTNYIGRSKPLRLTHGYHCYHQDAEIEVADLPAEKNGFITFGSFNALTKLSNKTIELWSSVLNAVPHSKLLLKRSPLNEEPVRRKLLSRFQDAGVEVDRIALEWEMNSTADHLAKYKNVDIALDSYPYSGTTTTCDALWMGVPVVSLCGENRSSRVSASILYQIGKSEWVADSEASFVRISKDICKSIEGLKDARRSLRNKIIKSSLYQENIVSKNLEEVLQSEWQRLCREKNNLPG